MRRRHGGEGGMDRDTETDSRRARFEAAFPDGFFLVPTDREGIERYARRMGWIGPEESLLSVAKAGEGNMNLTLRLETTAGSVILKQARPWVEKYPGIDAPADRGLVERAFYEAAASRPALGSMMPALRGSDPASGVLLLEDLGEAQDFTGLYRGGRLEENELQSLVSYLVELHVPFEGAPGVFANRAMRALNHEHVFRLPLQADNGIGLDGITKGLDDAARELIEDRPYVARVRELGALYLDDGPALVHGDYFPGSWLRTERGVRVIDPEFCFLGTPAFDLGVLLAHLHLARKPAEIEGRLFDLYRDPRSADETLFPLARRFAGVEIMRRLIGVAQLPLGLGIEEKRRLLDLSRGLVLLP